jgi:hypothetical protein
MVRLVRDQWRIRSLGAEELLLVPREETTAKERAKAKRLTRAELEGCFPESMGKRVWSEQLLLALCAAAGRPQHTVPALPRLREVVSEALASGDLVALRAPPPSGFSGKPRPLPQAEPVPQQEEEVRQKTWLELVLEDLEGNALAGERFKVVTPSGETREGKLDSHGRVRLEGLDPGNCKVSFPNLEPKLA